MSVKMRLFSLVYVIRLYCADDIMPCENYVNEICNFYTHTITYVVYL